MFSKISQKLSNIFDAFRYPLTSPMPWRGILVKFQTFSYLVDLFNAYIGWVGRPFLQCYEYAISLPCSMENFTFRVYYSLVIFTAKYRFSLNLKIFIVYFRQQLLTKCCLKLLHHDQNWKMSRKCFHSFLLSQKMKELQLRDFWHSPDR